MGNKKVRPETGPSHFCGGETIEECEETVVNLSNSKIGAILDYSVEGRHEEEDFGQTKEEIIRTIKRAKDDDRVPFAVFKVTGIAPLGTLEKISSDTELTEKGRWKWERIRERVNSICQYAHSIDQQLFIFDEIKTKGLSVRQTETLVRNLYREKETKKTTTNSLPEGYKKVEDKLATHFSTRVKMKHSKNGSGQITFDYYSLEELNKLLDQMNVQID